MVVQLKRNVPRPPFEGIVPTPHIKVISIGGGGGNALNHIIAHNLRSIDLIVADTDAQAIARSKTKYRIQLGTDISQGLCAERDLFREFLTDTDLLFIIAGMGGGTGTNLAPVIAEVAHEKGVLTIAVVTKPFGFEGNQRMRKAEVGIAELRKHVDAFIAIPNQTLIGAAVEDCSIPNAFRKADDVLLQAVRGISDLVTFIGYMNVNLDDVKAVLSGMSMMGFGIATGDNRACEAAKCAISSPLLDDVVIHGAPSILVNITGSQNMTLAEYDDAVSIIHSMADDDAIIICGMVYDQNAGDEMRVTVYSSSHALNHS